MRRSTWRPGTRPSSPTSSSWSSVSTCSSPQSSSSTSSLPWCQTLTSAYRYLTKTTKDFWKLNQPVSTTHRHQITSRVWAVIGAATIWRWVEVRAGQADPLDAPDRHVALADQPGHHLAGLPPPRLQERWGSLHCRPVLMMCFAGKKAKVEDYSKLENISSAKSTGGMFKKSKTCLLMLPTNKD